jgi:hypothetical protein
MTADGSPYNTNTAPAIATQTILDAMTAVFPSGEVTVASRYFGIRMLAAPDALMSGYNGAATAIAIGKAVVRDVATSGNGIKLAGADEIPLGFAATRINPGSCGDIILLDKANFPTDPILGAGATTTAGTMYKCAAAGALTTTTTPSEAVLIALDEGVLTSYVP